MTETDTADPAVNPDGLVMETLLTPEGRADPYPRYRQLRDVAPVHRSDLGAVWFLTRWADCNAVLRDPRLGKGDLNDDRRALFNPGLPPRQQTVMGNSMLFVNPPDHTRLRGLVSRGFTPRRMQDLEAHVGHMADVIVDRMAVEGDVDVMDALAFRLPVQVIGELVGVPPSDRDQFRTLVRASAAALEPGVTAEQVEDAEHAMAIMDDYFRSLIERRRADLEHDLVSALIAARDGEDRLSEDEMVATLILLFAAGFETTTNLIGNGLLCLLRNPDQFARLRAEPDLVGSAVEEMLRFESPVQVDARTAFEPVEIDGHRVGAGETVVTFLGAANRDPAEFVDPEHFDVARDPNHPLSFAAGIHYCLGANLARLEGRIVFDRLVRRTADIEWLDDAPDWRGTLILRGVNHLHVRITPSTSSAP
ncbi:MAG TPA: cytochrome P450 [Microthrixaceae bacterium]|nr:cytochrome P450 [Microthrixaceae bacterium]